MNLTRQTLWSMAPLLVVTVLNLASVPWFYGQLGADMYALWFYVITFTGAFGFMDLGLGVAVGRYMGVAIGAGRQDEVREIWGTGNLVALPLLLFFTLCFALVGVIWGPAWFKVGSEHGSLLRWCFVVAAVGLFLSYYGQLWWMACQVHLEFDYLGKLRTLMAVLQILPAMLIAWWTQNPLWLVCHGVGMCLLQQVILFVHVRRRHGLSFEWGLFRWARLQEMAAYTLKTFFSLLIGAAGGSLDRLLIGRLALPESFAAYNIASNVGGRMGVLSTAVMGPVFHNTSRGVGGDKSSEPGQVYESSFRLMVPWYLHALIWLLVWQDVVLGYWLGPDLGVNVGEVWPWLLSGYVLAAVGNLSGAQLGPLNRVGAGLGFQLASCMLMAAGVWVGWCLHGMAGAAMGFMLSRMVFLAQDAYVLRIIRARGWNSSWIWAVAAALLGAAAAFRWLGGVLPGEVPGWCTAVLHGFAATCWVAWITLYRRRP